MHQRFVKLFVLHKRDDFFADREDFHVPDSLHKFGNSLVEEIAVLHH